MLRLLRPALKCGNSEESQHAVEHVVKVEVIIEPLPLRHHRVLQGIFHVLQEESPGSRYSEESHEKRKKTTLPDSDQIFISKGRQPYWHSSSVILEESVQL